MISCCLVQLVVVCAGSPRGLGTSRAVWRGFRGSFSFIRIPLATFDRDPHAQISSHPEIVRVREECLLVQEHFKLKEKKWVSWICILYL